MRVVQRAELGFSSVDYEDSGEARRQGEYVVMAREPQTHEAQAAQTPLAEVIQAYLEREGISAYQLAKRVGVSPHVILNALYKGTSPQPGTLALLAQATGIALDELRTAAGKDRVKIERVDPRVLNALYDDMQARLNDDPALTQVEREKLYAAIEQVRRDRLAPFEGRGPQPSETESE